MFSVDCTISPLDVVDRIIFRIIASPFLHKLLPHKEKAAIQKAKSDVTQHQHPDL